MIAQMIAVRELQLAEQNPRTHGTGDIRQMADSIKAAGFLQPLLVMPEKGIYKVLDGSRRLAAAKLLGVEEVPCFVKTLDGAGAQEAVIIANLQRQELTPLEEAAALGVLVSLGRTQRDIAKRIGMTQQWVQHRLSLLALPESAQEALDNGVVTIEQARDLAKIADKPEIVERVVKRIAAGEKVPVASAAAVEMRRQELDEELAHRHDQLEGTGIAVFYDDEDGLPAEHDELWALRGVSEASHVDEPCHAVRLSIGFNRINEDLICTDPSRHGEGGNGDTNLEEQFEAKRAARKAEREVLGFAAEARLEACAELCRRQPSKASAEVIELAVISPLSEWPEPALVARILGVEVPEGDAGDPEDALWTTLVSNAHAGDRARQRLALACALASAEEHLATQLHDWMEHALQRHFAALATIGYEPTEAERALLEPVADETAVADVGSDAEAVAVERTTLREADA